jgi:hypothetical protein
VIGSRDARQVTPAHGFPAVVNTEWVAEKQRWLCEFV